MLTCLPRVYRPFKNGATRCWLKGSFAVLVTSAQPPKLWPTSWANVFQVRSEYQTTPTFLGSSQHASRAPKNPCIATLLDYMRHGVYSRPPPHVYVCVCIYIYIWYPHSMNPISGQCDSTPTALSWALDVICFSRGRWGVGRGPCSERFQLPTLNQKHNQHFWISRFWACVHSISRFPGF